MISERWWELTSGQSLGQGDILPGCTVPVMAERVEPLPAGQRTTSPFDIDIYDLIVLTQSCDLETDRAPLVAACPYFTVSDYEALNPDSGRRGRWEQVRPGRVEGLHLLASPIEPANNRLALVVDFRQIYSLPVRYLRWRAGELGSRPRLQSPYLEHFSQAFARFFMRVGLPASIPPYR